MLKGKCQGLSGGREWDFSRSFSSVNIEDLTIEHCDETEGDINLAMAHMRDLNISFTSDMGEIVM